MIDFSIRNPLVVNLLLVIVLLAGVLSWYAMPQEMFPVVEQDKVSIKTVRWNWYNWHLNCTYSINGRNRLF